MTVQQTAAIAQHNAKPHKAEPLTLAEKMQVDGRNQRLRDIWHTLDMAKKASWFISVGPADSLVRQAFIGLTEILLTHPMTWIAIDWDCSDLAPGFAVIANHDGDRLEIRIAGRAPLAAVADGLRQIRATWCAGMYFGPTIEPCPAWCTLHQADWPIRYDSCCEHADVISPASAESPSHVEVNVVQVRTWGQWLEPATVEVIGISSETVLTPSAAARLASALVRASDLAAGVDEVCSKGLPA